MKWDKGGVEEKRRGGGTLPRGCGHTADLDRKQGPLGSGDCQARPGPAFTQLIGAVGRNKCNSERQVMNMREEGFCRKGLGHAADPGEPQWGSSLPGGVEQLRRLLEVGAWSWGLARPGYPGEGLGAPGRNPRGGFSTGHTTDPALVFREEPGALVTIECVCCQVGGQWMWPETWPERGGRMRCLGCDHDNSKRGRGQTYLRGGKGWGGVGVAGPVGTFLAGSLSSEASKLGLLAGFRHKREKSRHEPGFSFKAVEPSQGKEHVRWAGIRDKGRLWQEAGLGNGSL